MSPAGRRRAAWSRAAVLLALCAALVVLATSGRAHALLFEVLSAGERLIARGPVVGAALFVVFSAVSAMFAFVSSAALVPVAVLAWGAPASVALLWAGWILGGICAYGIGRVPGRALLHWVTARPLPYRLEERLGRNAPLGLVVLFQLAVPSEAAGYALGLVRYRFQRYLLAVGLAELPYALATVYMSSAFVERRRGAILALGLALAGLSAVALWLLRRGFSGDDHRSAGPSA